MCGCNKSATSKITNFGSSKGPVKTVTNRPNLLSSRLGITQAAERARERINRLQKQSIQRLQRAALQRKFGR